MTVLKPNLPILNPLHPLARDLWAAWPMYEGAGQDVLHDVGGGRSHGTDWTGPPTWTVHKGQPCLDFTGGSHYITVPANGRAWDYTGPVTLLMRYWVTSSNSDPFGTKHDNENRFHLHAPYNGDLYWDYGNYGGDGRVSTSMAGYYETWFDLACVSAGKPGSFMAAYFDGDLQASSNASDGPDYAKTDGLGIGYSVGGDTLDGYIAFIYVWRRMLSQAQIRSLHTDPYQMFLPQSSAPTLAVTAAPTPLGTTDISLSWTDNAEHETGFTIERQTDGGAWEEVVTGLAADTESYTDSGVDQGYTYTYRVKAESTDLGDSEWSNIAEVTV